MKKINNKTIIFLLIIMLILGICLYAIKFINSNMYNDFKVTESIEEILPYEEEIQNTEEVSDSGKEDDKIIVVHVAGEVKNMGIVELPVNSRIADAIDAAGGLTELADISSVNLAYVLEDGMKIIIPSINDTDLEKELYIITNSGDNVIQSLNETVSTNSKNTLININTASQAELETLPGIGPSIALKIISYRSENGNFKSIDDIKNVNGIGDSKFEGIKNLICI